MSHYHQLWAEDKGRKYYDTFNFADPNFLMQEDCFKWVLGMALTDRKNIQVNSILEIGAGFGRLTKIVLEALTHYNVTDYTLLDISPDQLENAHRYLQRHLREDINFKMYCRDFLTFDEYKFPEVKPKQYDFVIAGEVLMHILPGNDIRAFVEKMVEFTKPGGDIITVDWTLGSMVSNQKEDNEWCFRHNYKRLFESTGLVYMDTVLDIPEIKQSIYHYKRKPSTIEEIE